MNPPPLRLFFQEPGLARGYRGYLCAFGGFLDAVDAWGKVPGFNVAALVSVRTLEMGWPMPPPVEGDPADEAVHLAGHLFALERVRLIAWLERLQDEGGYSVRTMAKLAWRQRDLECDLLNALAGVERKRDAA